MVYFKKVTTFATENNPKTAHMRRIFGIFTAFAMASALFVSPVMATPTEMEPVAVSANPETSDINVVVSGNTLRVTGAAKQTLTVYYLIGGKVASYAIDSDDQTINTGLSKGVYLVKVGKFVRKISIS